jgi:ElaB/YqjD/DUF883 family membrane-anchored ribosome-binding protein
MSRETERYEDEVGEIRDRMIRRIDLLANEFAPQSLLAKATGNAEAGLEDAIDIAADTIDAAADTVRRNPLSAALIGAGVLGIIASRAADRITFPDDEKTDVNIGVEGVDAGGRRYAASGTRRQTLNENISERTAQMTHAAKSKVEEAKSRVDELKTQASDLASDAGDTIRETAQSVRTATADTIDSARDTLKDTADDLGRRGREAGDAAVRKGRDTGHWIKDNPVATGLMVMAAGAAIGSVLTARRGGSDAGETASEALEQEAEEREETTDGRKGADRFDHLAREAEPKIPAKTAGQKTKSARAGKTGTGSPAASSPSARSGGTPNGPMESKTSVGTSRT